LILRQIILTETENNSVIAWIYGHYTVSLLCTKRDNPMMIYLVLPYTNGYTAPLTSKILTFMSQEEAYDYASDFKWVEVITTKLNG
jgi:cbb3-type cytochrome oxidase subunit 1